ncbi:hypothetical protein U1Q18_014570 [Sarracenia purpurea var. burkii]
MGIFALLNEIPASSRKYQFAVAMADKIVDENARNGHVELLHINRAALSSAFARTSGLLYRSLRSSSQAVDDHGTWTSRVDVRGGGRSSDAVEFSFGYSFPFSYHQSQGPGFHCEDLM